ncbi:hypothetical protein [Streptomyces poriticola]
MTNLRPPPPESDGFFRDGYEQQPARVQGSLEEGYSASLMVPV